MPGWYVHLEAAHDTARRLRDGSVPSTFAIDPAQARVIGEHCHTWRNYLALGALGPDLFYLLPDFTDTTGQVIRQVVRWALDVWEVVDSEFVSTWERWIGPISTNNAVRRRRLLLVGHVPLPPHVPVPLRAVPTGAGRARVGDDG